MKTGQESERIERVLPHIAAAFNEAAGGLGCTFSYDRDGETVTASGYDGALSMEVSVYGDSPLAVINDVVRQMYRRVV